MLNDEVPPNVIVHHFCSLPNSRVFRSGPLAGCPLYISSRKLRETSAIVAAISAGHGREARGLIPELRPGEVCCRWTPKRQWPPLLKRSVASIHLSPSARERLPPEPVSACRRQRRWWRRRPGRATRRPVSRTGLCRADHSERQVDALADTLFGLRDFVPPEPLHRPGHDDERAVAQPERPRLLGGVVPYPKRPCRPQGQRPNHVPYPRFVVGVQAHAVGPGAVAVQEAVIVPAPDALDSPLDLQQRRRPRDGLVDRAGEK